MTAEPGRHLPGSGGLRAALRFGIGFGLAMALALAADRLTTGRDFGWRLLLVIFYFSLGSAIAGAITAGLLRTLFGRAAASARFAAATILLALGSALASDALFVIHVFAVDGMEQTFPTRDWFNEVYYTGLGVSYLFAASGARLFVPFGAVAVLGAALWLARRRAL